MKPTTCNPLSQQGSALLEALIAVVLFSIGILGVVAMQATAAKFVADARFRIEASLLSDEIMGRIWSDVSNADAYHGFDSAVLANVATITPANMDSVIKTNCTVTNESIPANYCRWGYKVAATLPAARATVSSCPVDPDIAIPAGCPNPGSVVIDRTPDDASTHNVTVTITWTPPGQTDQRRYDVVSLVTDR